MLMRNEEQFLLYLFSFMQKRNGKHAANMFRTLSDETIEIKKNTEITSDFLPDK